MIASEKHLIQGKKIQTSRKQIFRHMEIFAKKRESPKQIYLKKTLVFLDFLRKIATAGFSRNISDKIL